MFEYNLYNTYPSLASRTGRYIAWMAGNICCGWCMDGWKYANSKLIGFQLGIVGLGKARQRRKPSLVIFWLEMCRANCRWFRWDKHPFGSDKIHPYLPSSFSFCSLVIKVRNSVKTNTIFQASFVLTICSNAVKRHDFYSLEQNVEYFLLKFT